MTDKTVVKQLSELLEPIRKDLGSINRKLGQHDKSFDSINRKLGIIDERLDGVDKRLDQYQSNFDDINERLDFHKDNLEEINKKQDQHTRSLVNIENTIKIYSDMYQTNNDNARKLEKRVVVLEDRNSIEPPPELRLADVG